MMKPAYRVDVRLQQKNPAEQELIAALDAKDGLYGGKNELMRECLLRGYMILKQKVDGLVLPAGEAAIRDALAGTFSSNEFIYRVIQAYLDTKMVRDVSEDHPCAGAAPVKDEQSSITQSPPVPTAIIPPTVEQVTSAPAPEPAPVRIAEPEPEPEPERKDDGGGRRLDWSKMRGIAGSSSWNGKE